MAIDSRDLARLAVRAAASRVVGGAVLVKGVAVFAVLLLLGIIVIGPIMAVSSVTGNTGGSAAQAGPMPAGASPTQIDGNGRELAKQIVAAADSGKVTWLFGADKQIEAYASDALWDGDTFTGPCYLDTRLLQVIVYVIGHFRTVGISSLNRRCTGETPGAGVFSMHWQGKAVDFFQFDGVPTTGRDAGAQEVIALLDPISQDRAAFGQSQCGPTPPLTNTYTFPDTCNHVHYQLGRGDDPLKL
ncbi:hypothetical protein [Clavibacter michiganensis]|uniref:hypothetical protein n=1 Tax=Clavibacter michiganensis TaxID=28447 RepID=UPI00142DC88A|nr:hypothetical protein [Clavibacter michiganensis]NIY62045.1 hypothetical protein [Clavibacter michiganensis subsp. michiganensis]QIT13072.1 hypothetical protein GRD74_15910 [Clavibacter michiganensis subsp. michiganensis]